MLITVTFCCYLLKRYCTIVQPPYRGKSPPRRDYFCSTHRSPEEERDLHLRSREGRREEIINSATQTHTKGIYDTSPPPRQWNHTPDYREEEYTEIERPPPPNTQTGIKITNRIFGSILPIFHITPSKRVLNNMWNKPPRPSPVQMHNHFQFRRLQFMELKSPSLPQSAFNSVVAPVHQLIEPKPPPPPSPTISQSFI